MPKKYDEILLFCDLDGTLLFDEDISEKKMELIKALKMQGVKIILNTGRPFRGISSLVKKYPNIFNGFILMNGALVLDENMKPNFSKYLDEDIVETIKKNPCDFTITFENQSGGYIYPKIDYDPWYKDYFYIINDLGLIPNNGIYLICVFRRSEGKDDINSKILVKKLKSLIKDRADMYVNEEFVDIVPKKVSKGDAMKYFRDDENMRYFTISIGDSENDIPMFLESNLSYAVDRNNENVNMVVDKCLPSADDCLNDILNLLSSYNMSVVI